MRIGIVTLPPHTNYGGILQAYALQTTLERMGNDVVVFDTNKHRSLPLWKMPLSYGKRILKKMLGRGGVIFREQKFNREYPIVSQHTQPFIDKYIHRIVVSDFRTLSPGDYDTIVVGSDQIWRARYDQIENAYLKFAHDWQIRRVAYAASFAVEKWEYTPRQTKQFAELVRKFDAVSVRESSGVALCREHFGVEALHVLDPTMLLTTDDYKLLIDQAGISTCEGNLGCYILDETKQTRQLIQRLATEKGLTPFRMNSRVEDMRAPLEERIQPPVERWLQSFIDAQLIITDSFHACVFSILFNKPFVVVANQDRGTARYDSLLGMFALQRCLYSQEWRPEDIFSIDWNSVNKRLEEWRNISFNYLSQINKMDK